MKSSTGPSSRLRVLVDVGAFEADERVEEDRAWPELRAGGQERFLPFRVVEADAPVRGDVELGHGVRLLGVTA